MTYPNYRTISIEFDRILSSGLYDPYLINVVVPMGVTPSYDIYENIYVDSYGGTLGPDSYTSSFENQY